MKQLSIIIGCVFLLISASCGGQKKTAGLPPRPDVSSFRGKSTDRVYCRLDSNTTYSLYLPSGYDTARRWPLIIAFDSHADGRLPVSLMKEGAEKYGYILVGSNTSKNGMPAEATSAIYDALIQDVKWRFAIDSLRIYTMGFSGGARVAAYQAIYKSGIKGVIGCSAGLPSNANPSEANFDYLGVVGKDDFNYLEMKQLFKSLDQTALPHWLLTFDGIHAWPPKETVSDIFDYLQIKAMKDGSIPQDTAWLGTAFRKNKERIASAERNKDGLKALEICSMAAYFFKGLPQGDEFSAKEKQISNQKDIINLLRQREDLLAKEKSLQQQYVQFLGNKQAGWWKTEVDRLNAVSSQKKGSEEAHVYKRLLGYLSLACYMNATQALTTQNWEAFRYFTVIYALVDPENSETAYLLAVKEMLDKQPSKALADLKLAVKLGFNDIKRLEADSAFQSLKADPEYINLSNSLRNSK